MTDAKSSEKSAGSKPAITIKKYANRRLYNTGTSTYVTLDDLATLVKAGEEFVVVDAKTGEDITRSVLTQIIFEQESRGGNMLPVSFLRQLIGYYGDQMQSLVPSYLDFTMQSLTREQGKLREQMTRAFGAQAMEAIEEQTRRNVEMFQNAMRMFSPFPMPQSGTATAKDQEPEAPEPVEADDDLKELKDQIAAMQRKIESMGKG